MINEMADRDSILEKHFPTPNDEDSQAIKDAMDQYMEETVLEAIEYIGRNIKWMVDKDGVILFWNGREYLTKEQLFENFL